MESPSQAIKPGGKKGRNQAMGKRRRAREMAMQMLYQHELGGSTLRDVFASFDLSGYQESEEGGSGERHLKLAEDSFQYARKLVEGTVGHGEEIDGVIRQHAENWRLERMPTIDRNILRVAVYEMLYEKNVPRVVIVDEAIELAKKFGAENSGRFVNGLLDGILQSQGSAASHRASVPAEGR